MQSTFMALVSITKGTPREKRPLLIGSGRPNEASTNEPPERWPLLQRTTPRPREGSRTTRPPLAEPVHGLPTSHPVVMLVLPTDSRTPLVVVVHVIEVSAQPAPDTRCLPESMTPPVAIGLNSVKGIRRARMMIQSAVRPSCCRCQKHRRRYRNSNELAPQTLSSLPWIRPCARSRT